MKKIFTFLFFISCTATFAQKLDKLTVERIMRDPKWIGTSPTNIYWSDDSKTIYFNWNPDKADGDALYSITPTNTTPQKVSIEDRRNLRPDFGDWNKKHTIKLYEKNGDIYLYDFKNNKTGRLTNTTDRESTPTFGADESKIIFTKGDNLYSLKLNGGELTQLTNFTRTAAGSTPTAPAFAGGGRRGGGNGGGAGRGPIAQTQNAASKQETWLKDEQLEIFDIIKKKTKDEKLTAAERKAMQAKPIKEIAIDEKRVSGLKLSPDSRYITYSLTKAADGARNTIVPNYVTASGYTEDISNRTKVGTPQSTTESFVYDLQRDTVYVISTKEIPGIKDLPDYVKEYPKQLEERTTRNEDRKVAIATTSWSEDGKNAVVTIFSDDNKDRWIMKLDPESGKLSPLDRQRDEAWIGGPGISSYGSSTGWLDNQHFYYQSEASGYSHIYIIDVATAEKKQITSGKWEVQTLKLSNNKKDFYFTANMDHPGVTDFYRVPVSGGTPVKLTSMRGGNEVELSPDEKWLAIRYSYVNKPYELFIQANKPGAKATQVTNSVSDEFKSYPWRTPEIFTFKNRYGTDIYARVYKPAHPLPSRPAVVFVHGAGYLQDVFYKWSTSYFREYMFNNMLTDLGYTVLEVDYTGSAGYGRDIRTGIYRHMGGKDLSDHVDAVKLLVEKYDVNPKNVGMYGGSYGGFMTLMALFTEPDVFAAGAGLRSVTDWAHYNHGYTDNILNEPYNDEKAYKLSSPIYFAGGLKGHLLMCHGMVDQNVNFQDIVRLSQRLIELHKKNWELAVFPVEDHGFIEPSSWTDEYSRILKLFDETLTK
ncbi:MAG: prolyl oligopeptidase family serine peptidase [Mucilaginibacter sp.]|uniref:prolyl oligopeptidase family serine peptidase n=1 Tax=Mucilaginibacter sp. TaxID=1882438 RepID=UPI0032647554